MFPLHLRLWVSLKTSLPQKEVQNLLWFEILGEGRGWRSENQERQIMDLLLNCTINKWSLLCRGKARCYLQTTLFQEMDAIPGSATCQPCDPRKVAIHPYLFCSCSLLRQLSGELHVQLKRSNLTCGACILINASEMQPHWIVTSGG